MSTGTLCHLLSHLNGGVRMSTGALCHSKSYLTENASLSISLCTNHSCISSGVQECQLVHCAIQNRISAGVRGCQLMRCAICNNNAQTSALRHSKHVNWLMCQYQFYQIRSAKMSIGALCHSKSYLTGSARKLSKQVIRELRA